MSTTKPPFSVERVLVGLRRAIAAGEFDATPRLSEPVLSRRFGVSRAPVREALRQLDAEGLVVIRPGAGAVVARPSAEDIEEIFSVRYALEGLAVRTVARTCTPQDRQAFGAVLAAMREAVARGQAARYARLARRFHDLVVDGAGNRRLQHIYRILHDQIDRFRRLTLSEAGTLLRSYRDHLAIGRAIARGDAAGAERRLQEHLSRVADAQLRLVTGSPIQRRQQWRG